MAVRALFGVEKIRQLFADGGRIWMPGLLSDAGVAILAGKLAMCGNMKFFSINPPACLGQCPGKRQINHSKQDRSALFYPYV